MSATSGFIGGVLLLSALEAVASSRFATTSIGEGFTSAADVLRRWADPDIPAIPDLRGTGGFLDKVQAGLGAVTSPSVAPTTPRVGTPLTSVVALGTPQFSTPNQTVST
ncbi:hypothetical protein [Jatrophihabitans sp.]|uniref:hypothetical protein n=1 Tax=Jatrophihabitans sp. TaxID=1932789 RepID=UPI0030C779AB|nr:hypothetical protein [Jatrophihabitans sp.]